MVNYSTNIVIMRSYGGLEGKERVKYDKL